MRAMGKWGLAAAVFALFIGACQYVAGLPDDVILAPTRTSTSSGSGGAGGVMESASATGAGGSTEGAIGVLGQPCPSIGELACNGHAQKERLVCNDEMKWQLSGTCDPGQNCDSSPGPDQGTCAAIVALCANSQPGDFVCNILDRVQCGPDLVTETHVDKCHYVCAPSGCTGVCKPNTEDCDGLQPQLCDATGTWQDTGPMCKAPANATAKCVGGKCRYASCQTDGPGLSDCGPMGDESCCASPVVSGGTYNRSYDGVTYVDAGYPATVSSFRLDRFEVTVGRFRTFAEGFAANKPAPSAGAHPLILNSGWDAAWDVNLDEDLLAAVKCSPTYTTWTDAAGVNEDKPMNCLSWYEAFAFCAWDGGRLPTEAEWNYAAAGGDEQRVYPWSSPPSSIVIDGTYAAYDCMGDGSGAADCAFTDILNVGSRSMKGDGRWGQADLGGSVWEWVLDYQSLSYPMPCIDCAYLKPAQGRMFRGGSWLGKSTGLLSSMRNFNGPGFRSLVIGVRCARAL